MTLPRAAPDRTTTDAEPGLRAISRLAPNATLFPEARVVMSCRSEGDACLLVDRSAPVPASGFTRFADLEEGYDARIFAQSGPWPQRAWMGASLLHESGGAPLLGIFEWTQAGWAKRLELSDATDYLGAGVWLGGRVITPVIHVYYNRHDGGEEAVLRRELIGNPRFEVISGPPSDELPLLDVDLDLYPRAFASLPSGHAFLVSGVLDGRALVVDRWAPGDRQPKRDRIDGLDPAPPGGDLPFFLDDPAQVVIVAAPNDVHVAVAAIDSAGKKRPAVARFDGRAWHVDILPCSRKSLSSFRRGPDGTLWIACGDQGPGSGELWRKPPGRPFEQVEIPESYSDGAPVRLFSVVEAWPRTATSLWVIARFDPRPAEVVHGLFVLDLPERTAAPQARR